MEQRSSPARFIERFTGRSRAHVHRLEAHLLSKANNTLASSMDGSCVFNPVGDCEMVSSKRRPPYWCQLDDVTRRTIAEYLDVLTIGSTDSAMARKEERKEWEKALHGLHSVALNEWPHYSNDNNFAGIRFCMRRGVALKGIRLTIKDKEYSPEVVDADLHYWWLCNNNHFEVALALIQSRSFAIDARISFKGFFDTTPLIYSCYRGNVDCVNALLDQGADVNKSNKSGWTALHIASQEGELPCLQGLLRAGATVDRQTDKGWTALMYAVKEGHESCVRALLAAGAARGDIAKVLCSRCRNHRAILTLIEEGDTKSKQ